jgi:uncharacterized protein
MTSSGKNKIIVDSIHGDIHLDEIEWRVIDTPSFQRLRSIKQLQMSHLTYPNATHTRFAHSIGVLAIMKKILEHESAKKLGLNDEEKICLKLASLLHDVGHYPYSHLVERLGKTKLAEDYLTARGNINPTKEFAELNYPEHDITGKLILENQGDILAAIENKERVQKVAAIFTGSDAKLSTFVTSSLDLDRMDYLLRDSYAAGVPYGHIDINYLLNNIEIDDEKLVCFSEKAIPAAEQFLLARFFMHKTVYWHKTTCGMEEVCCHLLKRLRNNKANKYKMPSNAAEVEVIFKSNELLAFTDAYIDQIIQEAVNYPINDNSDDSEKIIPILAKSIVYRKPPKLLKEVAFWHDGQEDNNKGEAFLRNFIDKITKLANDYNLLLGQFIFCEKSTRIEKTEEQIPVKDSKTLPDKTVEKSEREHREIVKIFQGDNEKSESLATRKESIISKFARQSFHLYRLYVVLGMNDSPEVVEKLKKEVEMWHKINI